MPASFDDQRKVVAALVDEISRMERAERRAPARALSDRYEQELRLAGLAQRVAQGYTMIEGVLAFVARRIDQVPVSGEDWHRKLIARCAQAFEDPPRPAVLSAALVDDLLELCEFRHVVRNIYPTRLAVAQVKENLDRLIRAVRQFDVETRTFAARQVAVRKSSRGRAKRRR